MITKEDLIIFPHDPMLDPEGYCTGYYILEDLKDRNDLEQLEKEKWFFINEKTGKVLEDLCPNIGVKTKIKLQYLKPELIDKDLWITFLDHKTVKFENNNKELKIDINDLYPTIGFGHNNKIYKFKVHILLAKLFIPYPKNHGKLSVDHKDINTYNYSLSNLRFVTKNIQRKNQRSTKNYTRLYHNITDNILYKPDELTENDRKSIIGAFHYNNCKYNGKYWKVYDIKVYKDLNGDYSKIDETKWEETKWIDGQNRKIYVHPDYPYLRLGNNFITKGSEVNRGYRNFFYFGIKYKRYNVLKIIACHFEKQDLDVNLEVDHIDGDPNNNHPNNIRLVDHKTNMLNINTISKKEKVVIQFSMEGIPLKKFRSFKRAKDLTGAVNVNSAASGIFKSSGGYKWRGEEKWLKNDYLELLKIDPDKAENIEKSLKNY